MRRRIVFDERTTKTTTFSTLLPSLPTFLSSSSEEKKKKKKKKKKTTTESGPALLETRRGKYPRTPKPPPSKKSSTLEEKRTSSSSLPLPKVDTKENAAESSARRRRSGREREERRRERESDDDDIAKHQKEATKTKEGKRRRRRRRRITNGVFISWRAMGVSGLVCAAASYLRLVIVPETVRDKAVEVFPSWVNETFLSLLPALNPDVLNSNLYYNATEHLVVARQVYDEYDGAKPKHPVVIVPGFVNTGLELWKSKPCIAKKTQFRQRMWGTPAMAKAFFHNRTCWLEHMALNATSGEDPDGIVLRPMAGIDSVDWFMPGYFVWGRMIEALGEIGYTGSNIHAHSYDWRLSPEQLEKRDGYFTKLKKQIEGMRESSPGQEKIALLAHSYGDTLSRYFLEWVESPKGGKGGANWVSDNIAAYVNIAGPTLGMPKSVSALLSGEMRDTAILNELEMTLGPMISTFVEKLIGSLEEITLVFRSWSSLWSMLPIGGDDVWGGSEIVASSSKNNPEEIIDETPLSADVADANFLTIREFSSKHQKKRKWETKKQKEDASTLTGLTMENSLHFLHDLAKQTTPKNAEASFKNRKRDKWYGHPLHSKLPNAPKMKIFCFYGVGKSTERSYRYTKDGFGDREYKLDVESDPTKLEWQKGTLSVDGDGSIPLVSLGYACASPWRTKSKNPSSIPIKIREYKHQRKPMIEGGFQGVTEGEHVNIMGNVELIRDVLKVVTGNGDDVAERIASNLHSIVRKIDERKRRTKTTRGLGR